MGKIEVEGDNFVQYFTAAKCFTEFWNAVSSILNPKPQLACRSTGVCRIIKLSGELWRRGERRKESLQQHLWNLNTTSNFPWAPRRLSYRIFANQRDVETRANVNKHWKTRAKGNGVITNVVSANQHFAWTKFRLDFFDADIKIPKTKLQALLYFYYSAFCINVLCMGISLCCRVTVKVLSASSTDWTRTLR